MSAITTSDTINTINTINTTNTTINPMSSADRRLRLVRKCTSLSDNEAQEMLRIINANKASYSSNGNGIFINLSYVSDKLLDEMERFIDFAQEKRPELDAYDTMKANLNRVMSQVNDEIPLHLITEPIGQNGPISQTGQNCQTRPMERALKMQVISDLINSKKDTGKFNTLKKRFCKAITSVANQTQTDELQRD